MAGLISGVSNFGKRVTYWAGTAVLGTALACTAAPVVGQTPMRQAEKQAGSTIITLGTGGGPLQRKNRAQSSNAIIVGDGFWLVDCGSGTLARMAQAGLDLRKLHGIFITHLHIDHVAELNALIVNRWALNIGGVFQIYGPRGTRELVDGLILADRPTVIASRGLGKAVLPLAHTVKVTEMTSASPSNVMRFTVSGLGRVSTVENTHLNYLSNEPGPPQSLSWRFDMADRSVVFTGDTGPSAEVEKLAAGADLMIGELIDTNLSLQMLSRATNYDSNVLSSLKVHLAQNHLTPGALGAMAARAGVKSLVVSHLVPGTQDAGQSLKYVQEISKEYKGPVVIAQDRDRY